ncbi:hypothetical protein CANMA_002132 [Candida margitis]|uniref:uncharacterized protein n=1 Tax=Candida margitis TaxID=1775924 RepID=UPI002226F744|nr:uncharacterized protein CANMA_002132 [Candida margitis]KAI5968696.1 hypothetical protein CANMA_002132 [Candida margitis]
MFTSSLRQKSVRAVFAAKRFNSSHSHHVEKKPIEITFAKIFAVGSLVGGWLLYKNKDKTETPLFKSGLFDQELNGQRDHLREEGYESRYKMGFIKAFIADNGGSGFGNSAYRRGSGEDVSSTNLIAAHSPWGPQFGAGIKLDKVGERRERIERFAPLK